MLDFPPGVTNLSVTLDIFGDDIVELDEMFSLQLAVPASMRGVSLGDPSTAIITIVDEDCECS